MTNSRVFDLDMEQVGWALVNALATSAALRHQHVADSLRDYVRRDEIPSEAQFVWDVITGGTTDAATKWFGSLLDARAFASYQAVSGLSAAAEPLPQESSE